MQHLLDFIHEHTLEEQLYIVAQLPAAELELMWQRRVSSDHWQARLHKSEGAWEFVHRHELLAHLCDRGADMLSVERELRAMVLTQIAYADNLMRDAKELLGPTVVQQAVQGHRDFIDDLQAAVRRVTTPARPSLVVVRGGGEQTASRAGHLTVLAPPPSAAAPAPAR
ncbi:MAG: hypothetical protein ABW321_04180 [Polyangiales bacterium]